MTRLTILSVGSDLKSAPNGMRSLRGCTYTIVWMRTSMSFCGPTESNQNYIHPPRPNHTLPVLLYRHITHHYAPPTTVTDPPLPHLPPPFPPLFAFAATFALFFSSLFPFFQSSTNSAKSPSSKSKNSSSYSSIPNPSSPPPDRALDLAIAAGRRDTRSTCALRSSSFR